jgi:hypothetical protein
MRSGKGQRTTITITTTTTTDLSYVATTTRLTKTNGFLGDGGKGGEMLETDGRWKRLNFMLLMLLTHATRAHPLSPAFVSPHPLPIHPYRVLPFSSSSSFIFPLHLLSWI